MLRLNMTAHSAALTESLFTMLTFKRSLASMHSNMIRQFLLWYKCFSAMWAFIPFVANMSLNVLIQTTLVSKPFIAFTIRTNEWFLAGVSTNVFLQICRIICWILTMRTFVSFFLFVCFWLWSLRCALKNNVFCQYGIGFDHEPQQISQCVGDWIHELYLQTAETEKYDFD